MKYLKLISIISISILILFSTYSVCTVFSFQSFRDYLPVILTTLVNISLCITLILLFNNKANLKDSKIKFSQFNKRQKIVSVFILIVILIPIGLFLIKSGKIILYSNLNAKDFGKITKKLEKWGYYFEFNPNGRKIKVKSKDRCNIKRKLTKAGIIPTGIKGWELFDTHNWTTTDFEKNVNLRRAMTGEITRHLKLLDDIEDVSIQITMPAKELNKKNIPWKASVIITPAPDSDILKNKKKIKGIRNIVAYGIDNLESKNVIIIDNKGNVLE